MPHYYFFSLREKLKLSESYLKFTEVPPHHALILLRKREHFIGVTKIQRALHLVQLSHWFGNY